MEKNDYHERYVRNVKAVGVIWFALTVCYAIINVLVFFQPNWLGSTERSPVQGVFGLYRYCTNEPSDDNIFVEQCNGRLNAYDSGILTVYFKVATILLGVSALLILICIVCTLLFFCVPAKHVYGLCGFLQFISFLCILIGCIVYPAGWEHPQVVAVCGSAKMYHRGSCELRFAYILALIGIFDAFFLSILAFVLATKQVKKLQTSANNGHTNLALPTASQGHRTTNGRMHEYEDAYILNRNQAHYVNSENRH